MKWSSLFSIRISELALDKLQNCSGVTFSSELSDIVHEMSQLIDEDFQRERGLDNEVRKMMDQLEEEGHQFERHKMHSLLKRQLAEKKGIIL